MRCLITQDASYTVLMREREINRILHPSNLGSISMFHSPVHDVLKFPTCMTGVEVGVGLFVVLHPVPHDRRNLGMAHNRLPDQFDAVI